MSYAKLKVSIDVDNCSMGPRGGTRYRIEKCVTDSRTGLLIGVDRRVGANLTLKEARKRKKEIIRDFYCIQDTKGISEVKVMTFGELIEQLNEIYQGNERDFKDRIVKILVGGKLANVDQVMFCNGDLVFSSAGGKEENYDAKSADG